MNYFGILFKSHACMHTQSIGKKQIMYIIKTDQTTMHAILHMYGSYTQ